MEKFNRYQFIIKIRLLNGGKTWRPTERHKRKIEMDAQNIKKTQDRHELIEERMGTEGIIVQDVKQ